MVQLEYYIIACVEGHIILKTYAIRGISMTSPSMVTTSLSLISFGSVVSNSTTAGTHKPGAIGLLGFFTRSWKYFKKR